MPKQKTRRLAYKKLRVIAGGKKIKHARAATSHNTGKKSSKRMRQLGGTKTVDKTNMYAAKKWFPYISKMT